MPKGSFHRIEGTLRRTRLGFMVEMRCGGGWFVDVGLRRVARLLDQPVRVEGTRVGFNLLAVSRIEHAGASPGRLSWRQRFKLR